LSIIVNGQKKKWLKNETIKELLKRMHYSFPLVVVKINDKLVHRKEFSEFKIPDKSEIKVIHMISGG